MTRGLLSIILIQKQTVLRWTVEEQLYLSCLTATLLALVPCQIFTYGSYNSEIVLGWTLHSEHHGCPWSATVRQSPQRDAYDNWHNNAQPGAQRTRCAWKRGRTPPYAGFSTSTPYYKRRKIPLCRQAILRPAQNCQNLALSTAQFMGIPGLPGRLRWCGVWRRSWHGL